MQNLKKIVKRFDRAKVLVVGDLILDEYIWGAVDRISPEAPVPVVWANRKTYVPGGAANVASNLSALGAKVCLVGATGRDKNTEILLNELEARKISHRGIFLEEGRHTTVKTRIIAGHQQVVRVDWEHRHPLTRNSNQRIMRFLRSQVEDFDAVIIEDYGKGVVNMELLKEIIPLARSRRKFVTVDPKEEHFDFYRQVSSITPNRKELENAVRYLKIKDAENRFKVHNDRLFTDKDIDLAANQVLEYLELDSILVTLGEQGMKLFEKGKKAVHIPTVAQEVFDVSGAGDTVISTFTLGLCAGASKLEAAHLANYAAGIVVGKVGTATTTRKELNERLSR